MLKVNVEKGLSLINRKCRFLRFEIWFQMLGTPGEAPTMHNCFTIPNLMTNHHIYITFTKRLVSIGEQEWRTRWWGRWRVKFPMSYRWTPLLGKHGSSVASLKLAKLVMTKLLNLIEKIEAHGLPSSSLVNIMLVTYFLLHACLRCTLYGNIGMIVDLKTFPLASKLATSSKCHGPLWLPSSKVGWLGTTISLWYWS